MKHFYAFSKQLQYLLYTYLLVIVIFFFYRCAMVGLNFSSMQTALSSSDQGGFSMLCKAFFMGYRFDTVVACYCLALPLVMLFVSYICNITGKIYYKSAHYITVTLFCLCIIVSTIDLPYFKYFFCRFNAQAFEWIDSPLFIFKMIVEEFSYFVFFFVVVVVIVLFIFLMGNIYRATLHAVYIHDKYQSSFSQKMLLNVLYFLLAFSLCFIGLRGRVEKKSPIRVGTAYFSNNAFLNQLGLNPSFTLFKSMQEKEESQNKPLSLMDSKKAEAYASTEMNKMFALQKENKRDIILDKQNTNVVLIMMESMTAANLSEFGAADNLTPNLNDISANSISYQNVYSAGIHTYNGVYSSLFGFPALLDKHTMKMTVIPKIQGGLPTMLKRNGFVTYYFTTHDEQFDNIAGFLSANDIEHIISQKDYPTKEVKSTLGVPDHVMFDRAITEMNHADKSKPFFCALLTASNHGPYIFPEGIDLKYHSTDTKDRIIEYADWAIGRFIAKARKQSWFSHTLFVFVADHGANKGTNYYPMPLNYNHTPLLFYYPRYISAKKDSHLGLQIDIPAMVCSYLGIDDNKTMGVAFDLAPRKYAYFCADDKMGVVNKDLFYVWDRKGINYLFRYPANDKINYISFPQYANTYADMRTYAFAMLMHAQNLLKTKSPNTK